MSHIGTNVGQSVAGLTRAENIAQRESRKQESVRRRDLARDDDSFELQEAQAIEAVRNLKENAGEEAHEDHRQKPGYEPETAAPRRLDVQG